MVARVETATISLALTIFFVGCSNSYTGCGAERSRPFSKPPSLERQTSARPSEPAPPPTATGGFDSAKAYAHVARLVEIGPRPPGSDGSRRTQTYIRDQLKAAGCTVEEDEFEASTPAGRVRMKNISGKAPGRSSSVVLLLSHYDTKLLPEAPNFAGANDGGSSTGVLLELARVLCDAPNRLTYWLAFVDGEEAYQTWSSTDGTYGSRQLAARLALADDLKRVKAVILADLVGYRELRFARESNSTPWLTDLVWSTAARLGYGKHFVDEAVAVEDDHTPFLRRGVAAVDIIQLNDYPHWHTAADTLDKISPRSLGVVGHVVLESLTTLEKKFR